MPPSLLPSDQNAKHLETPKRNSHLPLERTRCIPACRYQSRAYDSKLATIKSSKNRKEQGALFACKTPRTIYAPHKEEPVYQPALEAFQNRQKSSGRMIAGALGTYLC